MTRLELVGAVMEQMKAPFDLSKLSEDELERLYSAIKTARIIAWRRAKR